MKCVARITYDCPCVSSTCIWLEGNELYGGGVSLNMWNGIFYDASNELIQKKKLRKVESSQGGKCARKRKGEEVREQRFQGVSPMAPTTVFVCMCPVCVMLSWNSYAWGRLWID